MIAAVITTAIYTYRKSNGRLYDDDWFAIIGLWFFHPIVVLGFIVFILPFNIGQYIGDNWKEWIVALQLKLEKKKSWKDRIENGGEENVDRDNS